MAARRMTRSLREHQSAYEDQARVIQEKIATCREAYRDAKDALGDLRPAADDSTQRKSQLADRLFANILQLRTHSFNYEAAVSEWAELMEQHAIAQEDSDWANSMRRQHDDFFALAPTLKAQFGTLLAIYQDYHDRAEHRSADRQPPAPARPDGSNNASNATTPSQGDTGEPDTAIRRPAHPAGDNVQQRDFSPGGSRPAHTAGENDQVETPPRPVSDAGTTARPAAPQRPRQRVRIQEEPTDDLRNLTLRSEEIDNDHEFYDATPLSPVRTTRRTHYVSSSPYGIFAQSDGGLFTNATPMAWHTTRTGNGQHHETRFYSSTLQHPVRPRTPPPRAPQRAAPVSHAAHPAAGYRDEEMRNYRANPPPPMRERPADAAPYAEHRERLRQDLRGAPPAGGGRYSASTFAPAATAPPGTPPAAWTTQPLTSADYVYSRPPPPPVDHGVDFGPENASKFYQNAVYTRIPSNSTQPLVLNQSAVLKFDGDIRSFPAFRNRFLETVEGRKDTTSRHKLQYLLQCLSDEPLREASRYMITDANYFKVLDRLETRYGNRTKLLLLLSQCVFDLTPPGPSVSDLRRFHGEAESLFDELMQIGEDADQNPAWKQALTTKLPLTLRQKIFEKIPGDRLAAPTSQILALIEDYLLTLEDSDFASSWKNVATTAGNSDRPGPHRRTDPRSTAYRAGMHTTEADATYAANANGRRRRQCAFCGRDHWASQCDIYISIAQRIRRLKQLNYCLLCLRAGHWIGTCPKETDEACKYCNGPQHHRALCTGRTPKGHQPFASLRPSPVRASPPGVPGILKNEHGSSSGQETRDTTSVSRSGVPGSPTAKTVRFPSTHHSSMPGESNSKRRRQKKSQDSRTDPEGRAGTTRPTTASVAENVKQMAANACSGDGLLPDHQGHLTTDRLSTTAKAPWDDRMPGDGFSGMPGVPNTARQCGPWADEEASLPDSTGHCSDADTEPSTDECDDDPRFANYQDYSGYAVSTSSPADTKAVLLECLKTTAVNVNNGLSRPVIVFFDSGSSCSYIDMKLARDLRLPCLEKRCLRVNTFGTNTTTTIAGFDTTVLLRSPHGGQVSLVVTASDRIVPPVTTALLETDEVALLQGKSCSLVSTREKPDLLIGQDTVHLFNRYHGPKLPNGFYVVWSGLGPMVGGAGKVAVNRKATSTTVAAAVPHPAPPSDTVTTPPSGPVAKLTRHDLGYNPDDPLNLWSLDDLLDDREAPTQIPAHTAGSGRGELKVVTTSAHLCVLAEDDDADLSGDFSHVESEGLSSELYGTTAFSTLYLEPSSKRPQAQWFLQRSQQKEPNPLDTNAEPLLPTNSTNSAVAAVAYAAHPAAKPPKPPSKLSRSREKQEKFVRWSRPVRVRYYVVRPAVTRLQKLRRTMARRNRKRLRATALGFDPALCFTTLGRKPTRKTQLRHPPSSTDRRILGTAESQGLHYVNGRLSAPSFLAVAPRADPRADTLADQCKQTNTITEAAARAELRKRHLRKFVSLDHRTAPMPDSIIERIADGQFTEPGIVQVVAHTAAPEAPSTIVQVVAHTAAPEAPSISATIAEQNPRVQDNKAATDATAPPEPSATPDAATSSFTDATAIAALAAIQAVIATIADIEARTAPIAAGLAERKDLLLKISISTQGPRAPDRSPDTDPERDD